jgi:hypothetical protein
MATIDISGAETFFYIVTDLINALPGNSSVNTNRGNNRKENVFYMRSAPSKSTEL